ncbi:hypothetical protein PAXRUDRAFT_142293 [Paxillus rubicundulus Ve08.2h10]|uniref:DUF659 domain-containing protein n=1 Tax=Paxillus rubicundulus Ve08.2h10 TaxID=930991 RepID=A0A0D0E2C8_9AGAM|nr:hypothetical protein PAXRUDRAFT_142293 [Paxillus rubicundulus Ve08.2h10]
MDAELARVHLEEISCVKDRKKPTFLIDGWEDLLKRSLYGALAAEVNQYPIVLSLSDMTGHQGSANKLLEVSMDALKFMDMENAKNIIATTTDNPTVMQAFWKRFKGKFYWVLISKHLRITFLCFLHGLNTIIGDICSYPWMKQQVTKATRIITFFNGSHFWGGQLKEEAKRQKVTCTLKQNCESCWYAVILQAVSIKEHRQPLTMTCIQPDTVKKVNGLSPVAPDVVNILVKTAKPLVYTIGNCESCEASLASCMLELIQCAKKLSQLTLDGTDNTGFWMHAKAVFNRQFHAMNTDHHSLALFLHPMCRKLATSQAANSHNFEFMVKTALSIAKEWRWSEADAKSLIHNLKEYQKCTGVFAGGQADTLNWWDCLPVTVQQCPLKTLTVILHSVVPHAADVERYFSGLSGTQSSKCCNLTVETFKALSKLCSSYTHQLYKMDRAAGKSTHRKHTHMHTHPTLGVDTGLINELVKTFTWVPPLVADSDESEDNLAGPEAIMDKELEEAFGVIDCEKGDAQANTANMLDLNIELDGNAVLEGEVYDWKELEVVDKGTTPSGFMEDISISDKAVNNGQWDITTLLMSQGVALLL